MTGLRQRRGVLAVDRVDRLEEPKEHVHIHRVVRQGVLQGTLSFVGMLLPLLAFRALLLPQHFWAALPMSARCAAGPLGALVWRAGKLERFAPGRERWFLYSLRAAMAGLAMTPVISLVPGFAHPVFPDWSTCKIRMIESFDPPPPLMGEPATGTANPYPDSNKDDSKLSGHLLVLVRVVNMMLISPIVEALFFVGVCVEYSSGLFLNLFGLSAPALASSSAAFLWAVHAMHYKGELLLRLMLAAAIFAFLASLPSTPAPAREGEAVPVHESACAVLLFAAALGVRGGIAAWLAVSKGRWHRWLI